MTLLVAWVWHGLAIAVATAAVLACARGLSAATRHAIWWLAYAAAVALPALELIARCALAPSVAPVPAAAADTALPLPAVPDHLVALLAAGWTIYAVVGMRRILLSVAAMARLRRNSRPLDPARALRLPMWSSARTAGRSVRLHTWDGAGTACAVGFRRPTILLSRALVESLDDGALDAIVMHEHAHLERRDDRTQLLGAVMAAFAGWHPAVRFIGRRIHLEREAACDDRVVSRTGAPREYARTLVRAAACGSGGWRALTVPGAVESASVLRRRIRRLLDPDRNRDARVRTRVLVPAAAVLATAVALVARTPAFVVFVETAIHLPRVAPAVLPAAAAFRPRAIASPPFAPTGGPRRPAVAPDEIGGVRPRPPLAARPATPIAGPLAAAPVSRRTGEAVRPLEVSQRMLSAATMPVPREETTSPESWTKMARPAATGGQAIARAGTAAGHGAKEAGVSLARFFGRTGRTVAGRF
ncbi:MAG: M56 family metallopeptidase [Betaproteobacteria bacterium]